jgi:hypothetical protein
MYFFQVATPETTIYVYIFREIKNIQCDAQRTLYRETSTSGRLSFRLGSAVTDIKLHRNYSL